MSTVLGKTQPVVGADNDAWGTKQNDIDTELGLYATRLQLFANISSGDGDTLVLMDSRWNFTIRRATVRTKSLESTVTIKVNATGVTGLSTLYATTAETNTSATALNAGVAGDDIVITLSGTTADAVYVTLYVDRTSAGTA